MQLRGFVPCMWMCRAGQLRPAGEAIFEECPIIFLTLAKQQINLSFRLAKLEDLEEGWKSLVFGFNTPILPPIMCNFM